MATKQPQHCDGELQQQFDSAFTLLESAVDNGRIPGGVLGVTDLKLGRTARATGMAALKPDKREMQLDTWFDLASLTKVLFTTPRILALHHAGRIDLDAPLTSVIPDLNQQVPDAWQRQITFRQCLGHQTAFPGVFPLYTYGLEPQLLRHFVLQRDWPAGDAGYSDINFILLGIALERLEGKPIRAQDPGPGFAFAADPQHAAATEYCPWRQRILCGEVHDENCAALEGGGHAGLFGPITAVMNQAQEWLRRAQTEHPIVGLMRQPLSGTRTHGWERAHVGWSGGDRTSPATIGHTGFTGTGLWIDFENQRAWSLLTNRVHPSRHVHTGIAELRRAIGDALSAVR